MPDQGAPLDGVKVLEITQMIAAPSASLLLADYGAQVIKIEPPGGDGARRLRSPHVDTAGIAPVFAAYNRNKTVVEADMRDPDIHAAVIELIKQADVLIESSRPGAMDRLGFSAEEMRAINPRLVYASLTGFGAGPEGRRRGGVDILVQAESGLMAMTGHAGGVPTKVGFTIIDAAAGHVLCHGILAALLRRERTGEGDHVELSLYDAALHLQTGPLAEFMASGVQPPLMGNSAAFGAPADLFATADGALVISAAIPKLWVGLANALGLGHLTTDERFAESDTRNHNRAELHTLLQERFATQTTQHWVDTLSAIGQLVAAVQDYGQVAASALTAESGLLVEELRVVSNPVKIGGLVAPALVESVETLPTTFGSR